MRWLVGASIVIVAVLAAIAAAPLIDRDAVAHERAAERATPHPHPPPRHERARRRGARRSDAAVPILMYHVIGAPPAGAPYPGLFVAPTLFRRQVAWLHAHGFRAVTLDRVLAAWNGRATLPPHPVVLSFDDGYLGDATVAAPALARLHWPGVLNLIVSRMQPGSLAGLTRAMVHSMVARGWEVDSHTVHHLDVTTLSPDALRREVGRSRVLLRRMFGVPVEGFCYPAGRYDAVALRAVRRAGYRFAETEIPGAAVRRDDPLLLPRIRVPAGERPAQLGSAVEAALAAAHSR